MSTVETAIPAGDLNESPSLGELVARAESLQGLLRDEAPAGDRDRAVSRRVIDAITSAGLYKILVPKRLGGYETNARTHFEVARTLGRGDLAAGWVVGVQNTAAWQLCLFGEQAQRDVWESNPEARVCAVATNTSEAKLADGGLIVSGRYPTASGSRQSEWAIVTAPDVRKEGAQNSEFSEVLIPMHDLTVEDTWFPAGVRGSSSNTLVADEVFVPNHRILDLEAVLNNETGDRPDEPLYRSSVAAMAALGIVGSQIGAAEAALEIVMAKSPGRRVQFTPIDDQSSDPLFQARVAEAAIRIEAASLLARQVADETDAAALAGGFPSEERCAAARLSCAWASQEAAVAVDALMTEAGASAFMDGTPLQRIWRDVSTGHRNGLCRVDPARELYGRALLGKEIPEGTVF